MKDLPMEYKLKCWDHFIEQANKRSQKQNLVHVDVDGMKWNDEDIFQKNFNKIFK